MRILLTGKSGQVGYELERSLQVVGKVTALDRSQLDLNNFDQIRRVVREIKPSLIINPAAYTAVDSAESEIELAMRINGEAPRILAEEGAKVGAAMIHYSTDYVFDGTKSGAYRETDPSNPVNVYGKSKYIGERGVQEAGIPYLILRTSWVYGMHGKNFLKTVLRLAKERRELSIVDDQHGAPTWSRTIAEATAHIITLTMDREGNCDRFAELSGIYHLSAKGSTSWFGFAKAILQNAGIEDCKLNPIPSEQYPTPAQRPENSRLSCNLLEKTFTCLPEWDYALNLCQGNTN